MDDQLLAYLMKSLDADDHARVESQLGADTTAQTRLAALRALLDPLACDIDAYPPPACLAQRTLQRIASMPRELPPAPRLRIHGGGFSPHWRRADILVAASMLLCVLGLGLSWMNTLWGEEAVQVMECKNNMRQAYQALKVYCDKNGKRYPNVAAIKKPYNAAGLVTSLIKVPGESVESRTFVCPALQSKPAFKPLSDVISMDEATYKKYLKSLEECYAYSLGFKDGNIVSGYTHDQEKPNELIPILADCPPADAEADADSNSLSHGGKGQNVLFLDGHVKFATSRKMGYKQDDIYLNQCGKVAAGADWRDTVLASGSAMP